MINTCTRPLFAVEDGSCLDHIFYKSSFETVSGKVLNSMTDHYPVMLFLQNIGLKSIKKDISIMNKYKFMQLCRNENWNEIYLVHDLEEAVEQLLYKINNIKSRSTVKKSRKEMPRKEWITAAMIKSINTKNNLYKKWKLDYNNMAKKEKYLQYERVLKSAIRKMKILHEQKHLMNADSKKLWNYVKVKLDVKSKEHKIGDIQVNNDKIQTDTEKANYFNEFFSNVVEQLQVNVVPPISYSDIPDIPMNAHSLFLHPTNELEILQIINNIKNKAGGYDNIHAFDLKLAAPFIAPVLSHIINECLLQGIVPRQFKIAEVCPVHKSGSKTIVNNYRPIALISNIAKIFEKVVWTRLYNFATEYKLINDKQYGFLKNRGTDDAIALLSSLLYEKMNRSMPVVITFLDYSKAFDTVDHQILLSKLYNMGIRGICLSLFKSYLTDRMQYVKVNGSKSQSVNINVGVPQGSILGPLLFILYINDLLNMNMDVIAYADDSVLPISGKNWTILEYNVSNKLDIIYSWLYQNKLIININKTVFISFGNYCDSVPENFNLIMNGYPLRRAQDTKYLGVIYDYNIKWDKHVQNIVNKTKYLVYIFYKLKQVLSKRQLLQIYYGLFHSVATYGIIGWGGIYNTHFDSLCRLQNKLCKIIGLEEDDPDRPLTLRKIFVLKAILYQYEELKQEYVNKNIRTRIRSIQLPKTNLTIGQRGYKYYAIRYFNALPNNLKNLHVSSKTLKYKIKSELSKMNID